MALKTGVLYHLSDEEIPGHRKNITCFFKQKGEKMFNFSNKNQEEVSSGAISKGATASEGKAPSQEEFTKKRIAEIEEQRKAFLKKMPDFDMKAELNNEDFVNYLWKNGLSVEDAYLLVHRDEIIEKAAQETANRVLERRNRIPENGAGKATPASVKPNPKDMSDKEIADIIERVRSGEKISF